MTTHVPVSQAVTLHTVSAADRLEAHAVELPDYDRERLHDVAFMTAMSLCLMGNYAQTGHFGGPLAYTPYNVACHLAGPALGRTALRPARAEVRLRRQVHARGRALHSDLLRAVDHPVRSNTAAARGYGRRAFRLRRASGDAAHRRAGVPPRSRSARHAVGGERPDRASPLRGRQGSRHPCPVGACRVHRRHERRQRRPFRHRHRDRGGQGAVLGLRGRAAGTEGGRSRRRVRAHRGTCARAEEHRAGAAGWQAAAGDPLAEQRGDRRQPDRGCGQAALHGLRHRPAVGVVGLERLHDRQRERFRPGPRRLQGDGGMAGRRPAADDPGRPDGQGLVAGGSRWEDRRARADCRLSVPSLRVQDEQRLLRRAGRVVRAGLRGAVRGRSRRGPRRPRRSA